MGLKQYLFIWKQYLFIWKQYLFIWKEVVNTCNYNKYVYNEVNIEFYNKINNLMSIAKFCFYGFAVKFICVQSLKNLF